MYTEKIGLQNTGYAYEKIVKSILQIVSHLKKSSEITLTKGSFFFKFNESDQPVLILATELKTERPIMLLSNSMNTKLCLREPEDPKKFLKIRRKTRSYLKSASDVTK